VTDTSTTPEELEPEPEPEYVEEVAPERTPVLPGEDRPADAPPAPDAAPISETAAPVPPGA
jgi:hypothetical protein